MRAPAVFLVLLLVALPAAAQQDWQLLARSPQVALTDVVRLDAQRLCGVGDGVWCSGDDGATWNRSAGAEGNFTTIVFASPNEGWVVGTSGVARSTDGGRTWTAAGPPEATGLRFLGAFAGRVARVASAEAVWTTGDDGATWQRVEAPAQPLDPVRFYDASQWFAFTPGRLHTTTDAGVTWREHALPFNGTLRDARVVGAGDLAVLVDEGAQRTLWWTSDEGATWNAFHRTAARATSVFLAEGVVWLGGPGFLATSFDGTTWTTAFDQPDNPETRFRRTPDGTAFAWAADTNGTFVGYYAGPRPVAPAAAPPEPLPWEDANATAPPAPTTPPAGPDPTTTATGAGDQRTPFPALLALLALAFAAARPRRP